MIRAPLYLLIPIFLTLLIYWPGLSGPFILDDIQSISIAKVGSLSLNEWVSTLWGNDSGPFKRPLSVLTFILNDFFFGEDAYSYKLTNLVLHICNGILVFLLSKSLFQFYKRPLHKELWSVLVAALWMLHPLQVSTVLYVVQRMAMLSTFFVLLSLWSYVKFRLEPNSHRKWWTLLVFAVSALCAIASKENGILLPFYLCALEWCLAEKKEKHFKFWTVSSGLLLIGATAYYLYRWPSFQASFAEKGFTLLSYLNLESQALVFYIKLILLPSIQDMGLFHDDFPMVFLLPAWSTWILLIALVGAALAVKNRNPLISLGVLWFFLGHSLESSFLPLEPVFEHRNYFPMLGLLLATAGAVDTVVLKKVKATHALGLLCTLAIVTTTWLRVGHWTSAVPFMQTALYYHPKSARAHIEWANYLLMLKQDSEAKHHIEQGRLLSPHNSGPALHLVLLECANYSLNPDLITQAKKDLTTKSITPYTLLIFDALVQNSFTQRCNAIQPDKSILLIDTALQNPYVQYKKNYISNLYHLKAGLLVQQANYDEAINALDQSYALNPNKIDTLIEKVQVLNIQQKWLEAKQTMVFIQSRKNGQSTNIKARLQRLEQHLE